MLITRFNAIIRNRTLWAVFAIIISVSFIGTGLELGAGGCSQARGDAATAEGRLFDRFISPNDFMRARYYEMDMRQLQNPDESDLQQLRQATWRRIAALEMARQFGITIGKDELRDVIQQDRSFQENGQFSPRLYQGLLENQLRVTAETFEDYLHEQLIIQKMRSLIETSVWITPEEMERRIASLTDQFTITVFAVEPDKSLKKKIASREEAESFYAAHTNWFAVPESRQVAYVAYPVITPTNTDFITEDTILDYYSLNMERFSETDTNGLSIPVPLETVKDQIRSEILHHAAVREAKNLAADLVQEILDRSRSADAFDTVTREKALTVSTSSFFTLNEPVEGLAVGPDFNAAAFSLMPDVPDRSFSDATVGSNAVYVLAKTVIHPPHLPAFSNIIDRVMPYATTNLQAQALMDKATTTRQALMDSLTAKQPLEKAIKTAKLNVVTSLTCSVFGGIPDDFEHADLIAPALVSLDQGAVSEPLETETGYLLLYAEKREPGDFASAQTIRPQVMATLDRYRAGSLFTEWCDHVLAMGKFEDLTAKRIEEAAARLDE